MVPYKTEGSFCLLVHDDIATSSAWHAKGSGSLALEGRLPGLQIKGRKLQSRSNRARKRDLSQGERSVRDRIASVRVLRSILRATHAASSKRASAEP
jgi:hypothetical protein